MDLEHRRVTDVEYRYLIRVGFMWVLILKVFRVSMFSSRQREQTLIVFIAFLVLLLSSL